MQRVDSIAPTHLRLPGGRTARIDYRPGNPVPVVSARLQDCLGLLDTPRLDGGTSPMAPPEGCRAPVALPGTDAVIGVSGTDFLHQRTTLLKLSQRSGVKPDVTHILKIFQSKKEKNGAMQ